jgi:hypothetical protein
MIAFMSASLGVSALAMAAVASAFVLRRPGTLPFEGREIARSARAILAALALSVGACAAGYLFARFAPDSLERYWLNFFAGLIAVVMLAVLLPHGALRRLCFRLLALYLVAFGIVAVLGSLIRLWVAASTGRVLLPRARGTWISVQLEPYIFWYSVAGSALVLFVALYALREYFLRIRERRSDGARATRNASPGRLARR